MCLHSFTVNMLGSHGRAQGGFPILLNVFAYICFKCQELSSWLRLIRHHFFLGGRLCVWQKPLIEATQLRQTYGVLADPTVRSSSSCRESRTSHNYLRLDKMIRERLLIYVRPRIYNLWCILSSIQRKNKSPDLPVLGATGWYSRVHACWNDEAGRLPKAAKESAFSNWLKCWSTKMDRRHDIAPIHTCACMVWKLSGCK